MELMELDEARTRMLDAIEPITMCERIDLEAAAGRIVATPVQAQAAVPTFANAAMDGYAVHAADPRHASGDDFEIIEEVFAGHAPSKAVGPGTCARIFTGAPMPAGADAVIAQEDARRDGERVRFVEIPTSGRFVRRAGADVARGDLLVGAGTRLHAAHVAMLAAAGIATLEVLRRPRLAIVTNGDELRPPGVRLAPGQIHDTSGFALPALASQLPVEIATRRHVGDDPEALGAALDDLEDTDAILTVGGVSVGDADHVRAVLEQRGSLGFWRIALKPGKPFAFGHLGNRAFFGLPGNPVSSIVTFLLLVRPALQKLAGMHPEQLPRIRARLTAPVRKAPGRRDFQRARMQWAQDGTPTVAPFDRQDSNILSVMANADALLDLPSTAGDLLAGAAVDVIDLAGLLGAR